MVSSGVVRVAPGFCLRSVTGGMGPGELADGTEAGQGKLDCLVSKSSFNLGRLRRAVSFRGLSGELGRAVCHQERNKVPKNLYLSFWGLFSDVPKEQRDVIR